MRTECRWNDALAWLYWATSFGFIVAMYLVALI